MPTLVSSRVLVILLVVVAPVSGASPPSPHLIYVLADDLGWNDVGYHNSDVISPTIDLLSETGVRLDQTYVQPLCTPSRAALLSGVYPFRLGLQHKVIGVDRPACLPLDRKILPQVLRDNGYRTHMVGKWHLGYCKWECTPTYRGFESFYGYYHAWQDYFTHTLGSSYDYRFNMTVNRDGYGRYSTWDFARRAEQVIDNHDPDQSLFLYMSFQNVHEPLQVPEEYLDLYPNEPNKNRKLFMGMVTAMDDAIARLVTALINKDLYKDSIIVFSSDNGGYIAASGNNMPLRGGKTTVFEGGTRVPAFVHSPMLRKSGVTHTGLMHAVDWFPTMLTAAGIPLTELPPDLDGIDQWEAITTLGASPRDEVVYNLDYHSMPIQGKAAIRVGDYKLITGYPGPDLGWYKPGDEDLGFFYRTESEMHKAPGLNRSDEHYRYLFNLRDDPTEHNNLYGSLPEVVKRLQARLDEQSERYVTANYPDKSPLANPASFGGVLSPGWC